MESAESEPVKLKAATEILDRAGIRGGVEIDAKVDVNIQPAAILINERLMRLRPQASNILEIESEEAGGGETVEEVILEVEPVELETINNINQEENN
jgi:hypothetical protein